MFASNKKQSKGGVPPGTADKGQEQSTGTHATGHSVDDFSTTPPPEIDDETMLAIALMESQREMSDVDKEFNRVLAESVVEAELCGSTHDASQYQTQPQIPIENNAMQMQTTQYTVTYLGSQEVAVPTGVVTATEALAKICERHTATRKIVFKLSNEGLELIEIGANDGAVVPSQLICFVHAFAARESHTLPNALAVIVASESSPREYVCHCFGATADMCEEISSQFEIQFTLLASVSPSINNEQRQLQAAIVSNLCSSF